VCRINVENADHATVSMAVTLQDLDDGGLARAIRTQDCNALTGIDIEVEIRHGDEVTVAAGKTTYLDRTHLFTLDNSLRP
jgi:hypothetical protein